MSYFDRWEGFSLAFKWILIIIACELAVLAVLKSFPSLDAWAVVLNPVLLAAATVPLLHFAASRDRQSRDRLSGDPAGDHAHPQSRPNDLDGSSKRLRYHLEKALEMGRVGSWELDLLTNEVTWTRQTYKNFGVAEGTPMNYKKFMECVHPDDRKKLADQLQAAFEGKPYGEIEHRILVNGEVRWIRGRGELAFDENKRCISAVGYNQDITAKQQAQEQIRKSEEKYRGLVENSLVGVFVSTADGKVIYANKTMAEMYGFGTPGEFMQTKAFSHWKDLERRRDMLDELSEYGYISRFEAEFVTHSGETLITLISATLINDQIHGMSMDITGRKADEKELVRYRDHLEHLVSERTAELAQAKQLAEAANIAKDAFLANMSHEIRTPLNAILGFTHLLRNDSPTKIQIEKLEKIDFSAQHLLSVIKDILDISKIEAGEAALESIEFDLGDLLDGVVAFLAQHPDAEGLQFEVDHENAPAFLLGDPTRLRQILLNYAVNAVKFTEHGTVSLRVFMLEDSGDEALLKFEVEDTGIGIAPEKLGRLFTPFEQADVSTTRKYGGTGLGLAINKKLAGLMEGEVGAESELGRGSTFWFKVRLAKSRRPEPGCQPEEPESAMVQLQNRHANAKILLVEDNEINREVALSLLKRCGLAVDFAEDGLQAVQMAKDTCYDLVLMDVQMPKMDGWEATRTIRELPHRAELPILAMTANVFVEDRKACLDSGMNDFVAKPVDPENLFKTIARWLDR